MVSFTVIVPSKNAENLAACVRAVRTCEPTSTIVVIDDGILWYGTRGFVFGPEGYSDPAPVAVIPGRKPFIYARNCNLGINASGGSDVILLNDDALLETPHGFHELQEASEAHPEFGVISAVTDVVGNPAQRRQDVGLREERRTVAFVCVYIPRRTIERVGLLDERFTGYGWEDNDYCRRVREAGLKIGICDDCYVNHSSLKSTFRGLAHAAGDISAGREIYREKWGDCA